MHETGDTLVLQFMVPCPQCGGQNVWEIFQSFLVCEYCGAQLWYPETLKKPEYMLARDHIKQTDDLRWILAQYEAMRQQSLMVGALRGNQSHDPLPIDLTAEWVRAQLPNIEELTRRYLPQFEILDTFHVRVPYHLLTLDVLYNVLGRELSGVRKVYRTMGFRIEEILPAYPEWLDFRDKGLWITSERLKNLQPDDLTDGSFIEPRRKHDPVEQVFRTWALRREILQPEIQPIYFNSIIMRTRHWIVFRSYHLARVASPSISGWVMFDGQFRTIAGYPDAHEIRKIENARGQFNLSTEEALHLQILPFRCPVCGWDVPPRQHGSYLLCHNCGRLLRPSSSGLKPTIYRVISSLFNGNASGSHYVWLPFYRIQGQWKIQDQATDDFFDVIKILDRQGFISRYTDEVQIPSIFFPAFDVLRFTGYDRWVIEIIRQMLDRNPDIEETRIFVDYPLPDADKILYPQTFGESLNQVLLHFVPALLPPSVQSRLNPVLLKKLTEVSFKPILNELVYVRIPGKMGPDGFLRLDPGSVVWEPLASYQLPPDKVRTARRWKRKNRK